MCGGNSSHMPSWHRFRATLSVLPREPSNLPTCLSPAAEVLATIFSLGIYQLVRPACEPVGPLPFGAAAGVGGGGRTRRAAEVDLGWKLDQHLQQLRSVEEAAFASGNRTIQLLDGLIARLDGDLEEARVLSAPQPDVGPEISSLAPLPEFLSTFPAPAIEVTTAVPPRSRRRTTSEIICQLQ